MSKEKQTVTFVEDVEIITGKGAIEFEAKAGDVVDLVPASAARWIKRGKAVTGKQKPAAAEPELPADKPKPDRAPKPAKTTDAKTG